MSGNIIIPFVVVAWLLVQLIDIVTPIINAPDWVSKSLLIASIEGSAVISKILTHLDEKAAAAATQPVVHSK